VRQTSEELTPLSLELALELERGVDRADESSVSLARSARRPDRSPGRHWHSQTIESMDRST
jgi:hypothetical protein